MFAPLLSKRAEDRARFQPFVEGGHRESQWRRFRQQQQDPPALGKRLLSALLLGTQQVITRLVFLFCMLKLLQA